MRQVSMYPSGYGDTSLERRFTAGAAVPQNSIQTYRISLNAQKQVCGFEPMKLSSFRALCFPFRVTDRPPPGGGVCSRESEASRRQMLTNVTETSEVSEKKIVS